MIGGLGLIRPPLGAIRLEGSTKLIVSPWAAMGTDLLLISTGIATIHLSRHIGLKILGWGGTLWGTVALILEAIKLLQEDPKVSVEIIRQ